MVKLGTQVTSHGANKSKRALLIVNCQNCFFEGGAMAWDTSNFDLHHAIEMERNVLDKINELIQLQEKDLDYLKAGLSGSAVLNGKIEEIQHPLMEIGDKILDGTYPNGSRKKYYFDMIVYCQTAYSPDDPAFASHHYLRDKQTKVDMMREKIASKFKESGTELEEEDIDDGMLDYVPWSYVDKDFSNRGMTQYYNDHKLWADHALTDGGDIIIQNQKCYKGIDFHPKLDLRPLYRPNHSFSPDVYINKVELPGRGFVVYLTKYPKSAFKNEKDDETGLQRFLKKSDISEVYVCGTFRDIMVETTARDSAENGFNTHLLYDASLSTHFKGGIEGANEVEFDTILNYDNPWINKLGEEGVEVNLTTQILDSINPTVDVTSQLCFEGDVGIVRSIDAFMRTSTINSRGGSRKTQRRKRNRTRHIKKSAHLKKSRNTARSYKK